MDKKIKIGIYIIVTIAVFFAFFYFYQAAIFEAEIVGRYTSYTVDISLKAFFDHTALNSAIPQTNLLAVKPTVKGILLLVVCLLGVPIMVGYRLATANQEPKKQKK